ncbi:NAD(P)-binding protein [Byssothecium circinans]|uniref:NAD(P)-binding protein n=1 Tax=Byssothecium circinans TaxID=147558 RepID=A0A6A5TFV9_9PLEO|nr:NAD(P)-binding protein [Byssothecium circinans]
MTSFTISDADLANVKDKVVVLTGIGLATLNLLLAHGAKVFTSDLNPLPSQHANIPFKKVDVTSWSDQAGLFKAAHAEYGRIDHVFANAGIGPTESFLEEDLDEDGELKKPNLKTVEVNLTGVIYTVKLGIHYLRKNGAEGGSVVMTASASSFSRFPTPDYGAAKHAVLGLLRSLTGLLPRHNLPIRVNAISPSWTATNILPAGFAASLGDNIQTPDVAARSVVVLMADGKRRGELIFSDRGRFFEIEDGEGGMIKFIEGLTNVEALLNSGIESGQKAMAEKARV